MSTPLRYLLILFVTSIFSHLACQEVSSRKNPPKELIVTEPGEMEPSISGNIGELLANATANKGKADDSIRLNNPSEVASIYGAKANARIWSRDSSWLPVADSFMQMVDRCESYGLFPSDYHRRYLTGLFSRSQDSGHTQDAALWARGEVLLSDALVSYARHLRWGHLGRDSITLNKDSVLSQAFYDRVFAAVLPGGSPKKVLEGLEPPHNAYHELRAALPRFLDSLDRTPYTYVVYPFTDSLRFVKQLQSRLFESSFIRFNTRMPDSIELSTAIRRAQAARGLKVDGRPGTQLIASLNNNGMERFKRIAINLDRYRMQLPDSMPPSYIMVNLPAFRMQVVDSAGVVIESRVIVGQPRTRTPVLNSTVVNFVTYPQWTVPYSIIFKEMLPRIRNNPAYLDRQRLVVVDRNDSIIDPRTINWAKLSKTNFPYLLRQRQGDDNSLGVIKFNFLNPYSVYLHDTNARSLFGRQGRALSHGCVRVQAWDTLARYLIALDSTNIPMDSVNALMSRQEKRTVPLKKKLPLYIRYFTCEVARDGRIRFLDDIYGEDKALRIKYLARK